MNTNTEIILSIWTAKAHAYSMSWEMWNPIIIILVLLVVVYWLLYAKYHFESSEVSDFVLLVGVLISAVVTIISLVHFGNYDNYILAKYHPNEWALDHIKDIIFSATR